MRVEARIGKFPFWNTLAPDDQAMRSNVWLVRKGLLCCVSNWDGSSQKTEAPFPNSGGELSKQLEAALICRPGLICSAPRHLRSFTYTAPDVYGYKNVWIHTSLLMARAQAIRTLLHSLVVPQWHHLGQTCHFSAPPSSACWGPGTEGKRAMTQSYHQPPLGLHVSVQIQSDITTSTYHHLSYWSQVTGEESVLAVSLCLLLSPSLSPPPSLSLSTCSRNTSYGPLHLMDQCWPMTVSQQMGISYLHGSSEPGNPLGHMSATVLVMWGWDRDPGTQTPKARWGAKPGAALRPRGTKPIAEALHDCRCSGHQGQKSHRTPAYQSREHVPVRCSRPGPRGTLDTACSHCRSSQPGCWGTWDTRSCWCLFSARRDKVGINPTGFLLRTTGV